MGRRRLWLIGVTALALVGFVLALALLQPNDPFRFVRGREPYRLRENSKAASWRFSWREDADAVIARARPELLDAGFKPMPRNRLAPKDVTIWLFERPKPDHGWFKDTAYIAADQRPLSDGSPSPAPGWVMVGIDFIAPTPPSLWDRIKAVFGR